MKTLIDTDGKRLEKLADKCHGKKDALISLLQDIQLENNWLSQQVLRGVAEKLNIPLTEVYGVATFFKAFSLKPRGRHIVTACVGTACHVRGAPRLVDELRNILKIAPGETTPDKIFTLETVNCLGACALGPVVVIDGVYHGQATRSKVRMLIEEIRKLETRKRKTNHDKAKKQPSS
ncbi:MAG: NAD(P)H-dependent oxidoreductase subunit E [Elusimicrobia bacterium]|nr:NAD(P)H-dependent oxidoreductase subunit E [Elusimicrobiota bacterium]